MGLYKVTWEIDLEADSPEEAARLALEIHRDPESTATCFDVSAHDAEVDCTVDLHEGTTVHH